jgi:hypothetical protein
MARFEDLDLDPDQGPGTRGQEVQKVLDAIEEMRSSGSFDRMDDFLRDVGDSIEQYGRVTEGQLKAINNIREKRGWEEL